MFSQSIRSGHQLKSGIAGILVVVALACDGPTEPDVELHPDIRPYVMGEAAAALDEVGQFRIAMDIPPGTDAPAVVSAARARDLGTAYLQSFGPSLHPFWQQERGRSISLQSLTVGTRVFPMLTPYGPVPPIGCHSAYDRLFGSYYLMTLASGAEPEVALAVSAQTTDYVIDSDGNLDSPARSGEDFLSTGVPVNAGVRWSLSPEQAVAIVARATGANVTSVPVLVLRNVSYSPTIPLWRITLDRPVQVHVGGQTSATETLYLENSRSFYIATDVQPTVIVKECLLVDEQLVEHGTGTIEVPVKPSWPVEFVSVSFR